MNFNEYQLWYLANGRHDAREAHQLLRLAQNHIRGKYAESIKYSNRQLAEGILNMMDFDRKQYEHYSMLTGEHDTHVQSVMDEEINHVHRSMGEVIRSAWEEPTPNEAEIAQEIADREVLPELEEMEEHLNKLEFVKVIKH